MDFRRYLNNYLKHKEIDRKVVSSNVYRDWLCSMLDKWKQFDDEFFDEAGGIDKKYGNLLHAFFSLVEDSLCCEIASYADESIGFPNRGYYIKIGEIYAKIIMVWGQGSYTYIQKITKEEAELHLENLIKYIDLDSIIFGNKSKNE